MATHRFTRSWAVVSLAAITALLAVSASTPAQAIKTGFREETAEAFWEVPFTCPDGSTAPGTLLVKPTRFIEAPANDDPNPTVRLQFLAVCSGSSFSWGAPTAAATVTIKKHLRQMHAIGTGTAVDNLGGTHPVSFDVVWNGIGPVQKTVNAPGSTTRIRAATADGQVTFDGGLIANGPANHPTRPAPFIRVDRER
jgi:hypothetical protein